MPHVHLRVCSNVAWWQWLEHLRDVWVDHVDHTWIQYDTVGKTGKSLFEVGT